MFATTIPLNFAVIKNDPQRVSIIELFMNK